MLMSDWLVRDKWGCDRPISVRCWCDRLVSDG